MHLAQVLLVAIFAVAGGAKLLDRAGTRKAVVDFGAPERFAGPLALLLPIAELTVAGLLLARPTVVAGTIGALALLVLFSGAIGLSLARGHAPNCHCFGQLGSAPASWKTLVRNVVLCGLAAFVLVMNGREPPFNAVAWISRLGGAELLALVVGVVAALLLTVGVSAFLTLLRSYGRVLVRLERVEAALEAAGIRLPRDVEVPELGLRPGTPAPAFAATDDAGRAVSLEHLLAPGVPVLLLFMSAQCGPCKDLFPIAAEWQRAHADKLAIVVAIDGRLQEVRAATDEFNLRSVLVDTDTTVYRAYQGSGTPSAVLINADGTIGSWVAPGRDLIDRLVTQAVTTIPVGAPAPALELLSLNGERVSLATFRGRETLLLFWNPGCGFCQAMRDNILAWEKSANGQTVRLAVISSGDAESARAEGFRSPVFLDEDSAVSAAFGVNGTPMAVRLDADGRVASQIVAGSDAVLALTNGRA